MLPHGSMKINNLHQIDSIYDIKHKIKPPPPKFLGKCELLDQEPINLANLKYDYNQYSYLNNGIIRENDLLESLIVHHYNELPSIHPLFIHSSGIFTPIVVHSEQHSPDVEILSNNHYNMVHYWTHGILSLEWFRSYKLISNNHHNVQKRFGVYIRDVSGTRTYRLDLLSKLAHFSNQVYYHIQPPVVNEIVNQNKTHLFKSWDIATNNINSDESARINWEDTENFDIHLVPETLFSTEKTHLTEKICKPIVMQQPFIIIGPPNSLNYIKTYGFKTFDSIWDESYDKITDHKKRLHTIIQLISHIASLPPDKYQKLLSATFSIVEFNHQHFYGNFENILLSELHNNFNTALQHQQTKFFSMPGGTLMHYYNKLYSNTNTNINTLDKNRISQALKYLKYSNNNVYESTISKYKDLLVRF